MTVQIRTTQILKNNFQMTISQKVIQILKR